jgi:hypothetical protein
MSMPYAALMASSATAIIEEFSGFSRFAPATAVTSRQGRTVGRVIIAAATRTG